MKKFSKYIAKILAISCICLILIFVFLSTSTFFTAKLESSLFQFGELNGKLRERSLMFKDWVNNPVEKKALFIGSSAMYRNYNPDYLKNKVSGFNIGSPGMNIESAKDILSSFVELDIDYFVLDVTPTLWNLKRFETRKNWIQDWYNPLTKEVFEIAINSKRLKEYLMYTYSIIKYLNPLSKYHPLDLKRKSKLFPSGTDCITIESKTKEAYQNYDLELSNNNSKSITEIDQLFKRKKKKIFYVINPNINLDYNLDSFPVKVIDFNDVIQIKPKYFNDEVHLNCEGMNIFSIQSSNIYDQLFNQIN